MRTGYAGRATLRTGRLQNSLLVTSIVTYDFEHPFFHGRAHHDLLGLFE